MYYLEISFYDYNSHNIDFVKYSFDNYKELLNTLRQFIDDDDIHNFSIYKD